MHITDEAWHFAQCHVYQDFALSIGKANDLIFLLQLGTRQQQKAVNAQIVFKCFV